MRDSSTRDPFMRSAGRSKSYLIVGNLQRDIPRDRNDSAGRLLTLEGTRGATWRLIEGIHEGEE